MDAAWPPAGGAMGHAPEVLAPKGRLFFLSAKGLEKHRRGSNAELGMRLLRRLAKNHDGVRSAETRQHYIQIYQAMKYLSLDIADFLEKGPQMPGPPRV